MIGTSLGPYKIIEKLGEGAMGEVWRAEHQMLGRPAAIKFVRGDGSALAGGDTPSTAPGSGSWEEGQETLRLRFEREARATASLQSPHTVALYDFGVTPEGRFYYVMEFLDGIDLDTLVRRAGAIPAERAVHLLRQACESLADAHQRGMIHRDVKLANIFICRIGTKVDYVKVLDFGLVKTFGEVEDVNLTVEGGILGTPAFLAPEMMQEDGRIDGRTDVYSLGCVAYWLLTGAGVFAGGDLRQMFVDTLRTVPEPPSSRTARGIPPALDEIVLSCLEKNPDRRPSGATELADMLESCDLPRKWDQQRAREWWRLHRPC